jgi:hypothetical protein
VKVLEGSWIYNFPIHHILHFYSKIWRKFSSNRVSGTLFSGRRPSQRRPCRAALHRAVQPGPRPHALGPEGALSRGRVVPRPRAPSGREPRPRYGVSRHRTRRYRAEQQGETSRPPINGFRRSLRVCASFPRLVASLTSPGEVQPRRSTVSGGRHRWLPARRPPVAFFLRPSPQTGP